MANKILHLITAETIVTTKSPFVRLGILCSLFTCLFAVNICSRVYFATPFYYTSQLLMSAMILNIYPVMLVASFLGGVEHGSNTWSVRLASKRDHVFISKALVVFLASCLTTVMLLLFGLFFDLVSGGFLLTAFQVVLFQCFATILALMFWGLVALCTSMVLKNTWYGFIACLLYYYAEQFFAQALSSTISFYLPVWNMKSVFIHIFDQTGAFGFVQNEYGALMLSTVVCIIYYIVLVLLTVIMFLKAPLET